MSSRILGLALAMACAAPVALADDGPCALSTEQTEGEVVSLNMALMRARETDLRPELVNAAIRLARTERAIAALRPEDTVGLEFEDFPGIGSGGNLAALQVTGTFSRVWERGGKREAREALADAGVRVAEAEIDIAHYDLRREVEVLYLEAAIAAKRVDLACERVAISRNLETSVRQRVDAARDPLLSGARASSERLQAEADVRRYAARAENLRAVLASYWLATEDFNIDPAYLSSFSMTSRASLSDLYTPVLERLTAQRDVAEAEIELERAKAIPDVTWKVGVRKFGIEEDMAVIGGASIPLGMSRRSDASIAKLRAEQRRLDAEAEVLQQQMLREAVAYQRDALMAIDEIEEIETILIPAAMEAVELAEEGYKRGAFSYLEVIDAQRVVAELREERFEHLSHYLKSEAALLRMSAPSSERTLMETQQ